MALLNFIDMRKMKNYRNLMLVVVAMATLSCAKELVPNEPKENANLSPLSIVASSEKGDVRAAFSEDDYPAIVWQGNESITVLGENTGNQTFSTTSTGANAVFSGLADLTDDVLYSVYPADGNIKLNKTTDGTVKLANVTIPAVQTAVAGSFDPKAYTAVAKSSDDKANFSFKSLVSFLKFSLEDAENVDAVVIAGNNNENMACTASAVTLEGSHAGDYTNVSRYVRLQGTFETGKAYFMTVRPLAFNEGVTIYVQYNDGSVKSCKAKGPLFTVGKVRNHIKPLGTIPSSKLQPVTDLYTLYNLGFDIDVAGMVVNKTTFPSVNYISSTSKDKTLKSGVNFVDADVVAEFPAAGLTLPFIVAGNTEGSRTTLNATSQVNLVSSKTISDNVVRFQNINLSTEGTSEKNYLIANTADNAINSIGFKDCGIELVGDKSLMYMAATRPVNSLVMEECDVKMNSTKATNNFILQVSGAVYTMTELTFTNNVFWSDSETGTKSFSLYLDRKAAVTALTVTHNTFVNVYPQASYAYCQINDMVSGDIANNLFYFEDYTTATANAKGDGTYTGIVKEETSENVVEDDYSAFSNNYAIYAVETIPKQKLKLGQNAKTTSIVDKKQSEASEVFDFTDDSENFNIAKGIFKPKKAEYGAQR